MKIVIDIPEETANKIKDNVMFADSLPSDIRWDVTSAIVNGTPLTPTVLADALMEERIRGKLNSDTIFEKDIIRDVKCRLTVNIIDHRPCYCGAELREVWRESEDA